MIRWILIVLLVILLIIAAVLFFRWINQPAEESAGVTEPSAPVAAPDSYTTTEGTAVQGNVLQNDVDQDNDISELTVNPTPASPPANGTVTINENGDFTYTPNAGYVGQDSFKYEVCDPDGNCVTQTVVIVINSAVAESAPAPPAGGETPAGGEAADSEAPAGGDMAGGGEAPVGGETPAGGDMAGGETPAGGIPGQDDQAGGGVSQPPAGSESPAGTGGQPIPVPPVAPMTHVVQEGEWLIQIARCYGANPEIIAAQNGIPYPSWINPGLNLTISDVSSVSQPFYPPCIMRYTVQQGDTLYSIANFFKVPLDMLIKANYGCYSPYTVSDKVYSGCDNPYTPTIYPGQVLIIPVNLENQDMRAQYP